MLCVRETPLHIGHLRLMTQAAEIGAVIMPPVPAFYHLPQTLDDVINQTVNRVLDQFGIPFRTTFLFAGRAHSVVCLACIIVPVALFQGNFVTAIISSTFNSLKPPKRCGSTVIPAIFNIRTILQRFINKFNVESFC